MITSGHAAFGVERAGRRDSHEHRGPSIALMDTPTGHPADLARLVAEPDLLPVAVEELLRFYAPVTVARLIEADTDVGGCPVQAGQRILLNFGSANRDPTVFEDPDRFVIDRPINRHVTFGAGVHRCIGSNLARLELQVALRAWLARYPRILV